MRPPCGSEKDARIWSLSSNGDYTVRSAYRSIIERDQQFNNLRVDGNWRQLWQADVPPKVKHHVWRLARNVLPTKVALRGRRVPIEQTCGCCGLMEETLEHLFFSCKVAEQCWELVGETTAVRAAMQLEGGAIEWLFGIIANATRDRVSQIFTVFWSLWRERNERVWNHSSRPPEIIVRMGLEVIAEWRLCQPTPVDQARGARRGGCTRWHRPAADRVKVNVDAALFPGQRSFGIGMVARNDGGQMLSFSHAAFPGVPLPKEAEARGLLEDIRWMLATRLKPVDYETDCLLVQQAIERGGSDNTEFGRLIMECQQLLRHQPLSKVIFARRECNRVARGGSPGFRKWVFSLFPSSDTKLRFLFRQTLVSFSDKLILIPFLSNSLYLTNFFLFSSPFCFFFILI
ncbi:Putative ribonuclease H protein At1g65750 [Linum perenne]